MRFHLALVCRGRGFRSVPMRPRRANNRDIELWQGTWVVASMDERRASRSTADKFAKIKLTVHGTDYHFKNGDFQRAWHATASTPRSNPKQLDIIVGDGTDKGKVHLTIYQFDDERLTLCLDAAEQDAPDQFDATKGSGRIVEVWKRVQP